MPNHAARWESVLVWWGRVAIVLAFGVTAAAWTGWATGVDVLTRVSVSWPPVAPWTAVLLAAIAVAVGLQSGLSSNRLVWLGLLLAALVGVLAVVMLVEYVTGRSFGVDQMWFPTAIEAVYTHWPGRPSPQTLVTALLLSGAAALANLEPRWARAVWATCLLVVAATMAVDMAAYLFGAHHFVTVSGATGTSILTGASVLLIVAGSLMTHPNGYPIAWLIGRPDSKSLIRMIGLFAGLPVLIALLRSTLVWVGLHEESAIAVAVAAGVGVAGVLVFYLSQREQGLLIAAEVIGRERAEAEERYRILAENAVDVVIHTRGVRVVWISQSVQAAFGDPPEKWIGSDFSQRVHPDDIDTVIAGQEELKSGSSAVVRFRLRNAEGGYHWVEGRAKPYIDAEGNVDGTTGSIRIVDDQVEAERQLRRLARYDTLTGLVNRAEALARLEAAITCSRVPGAELGVLFCDIDRFKVINDTYGHSVGDAVLWTVADRVSQCVRHGDTVGRTGGDEMLVLLPGLHSLAEAVQIAEKIQARTAAPIHHCGNTFHATLSIGATLAVPGESVTETTARADAAMYRAKHAGGSTVCHI